MNLKPIQYNFTGGTLLENGIKEFRLENESFVTFWWSDMSAGKIVETMHFFICFTLRCFQFLKRLRSFLRQWICSLRPILFVYCWSSSILSKRSSASLASEAPLTFPFDPRSTNQQQRNCPNSPLQGRGSVSSQQTLHGHRASAVKRHDGERIPASKNGKLAGSR